MKTPRLCRAAVLGLALGLTAFPGAFAGTLTVRPGVPNVGGLARYMGSHGLEVNVASPDRAAAFVQSSHPSAEATYRARFYVNLRGVSMAGGNELDLFIAYSGADPTPPTTTGSALVRVVARQVGGQKVLSAFVRPDSGVEIEIPSEVVMADGWRAVEINWAKSTGASNGRLELWVDGVRRANLTGIDNDLATINYTRMGTVTGVDSGTSGVLKLDDFASQRTGYIGLASVFSDVPTSATYWPSVQGLYAAEITAGCATGQFCPTNNVTRAEMSVFLLRARRGPDFTAPAASGIFSDVAPSFWGAPWIEQLYRDGLTGGCNTAPLRYCPNAVVNRAEMAVFLLRAKYGTGYTPPPAAGTRFTDVPAGYWAAPWIEQLAREGITAGCGGTQYCPTAAVNRWQMALFLVKTFNLPEQRVGP